MFCIHHALYQINSLNLGSLADQLWINRLESPWIRWTSPLKMYCVLRRISGELWHTKSNIKGHAIHLLPRYFHWQLTYMEPQPITTVCYTWWSVGHRGLQCFTSGTYVNYRLTSTGYLLDCMDLYMAPKKTHGQDRSHVCGITVHHCQCWRKNTIRIV